MGSRLRIRNMYVREGLSEFLGTFVLMAFGHASGAQVTLSRGVLGTPQSIHWGWGLAVVMGVYASGAVSGGHLNPAVTLAQAFIGKLKWKKVPAYFIGQYLGSFLATACIYLVYFDAINHYDGGERQVYGPNKTAQIWTTFPQDYVSTWNCLGDQIFATGLLCLCIVAITDPRNMNPSPGVTAISVGFIVVTIGMTFHLNCAYAVNPARDFSPRAFIALAGWGREVFSYRDYNFFWVPIVGPHIGGVLGSYVYLLCVGYHWPDEGVSDQEKEVDPLSINGKDVDHVINECARLYVPKSECGTDLDLNSNTNDPTGQCRPTPTLLTMPNGGTLWPLPVSGLSAESTTKSMSFRVSAAGAGDRTVTTAM